MLRRLHCSLLIEREGRGGAGASAIGGENDDVGWSLLFTFRSVLFIFSSVLFTFRRTFPGFPWISLGIFGTFWAILGKAGHGRDWWRRVPGRSGLAEGLPFVPVA